jgi:hypothetical protein
MRVMGQHGNTPKANAPDWVSRTGHLASGCYDDGINARRRVKGEQKENIKKLMSLAGPVGLIASKGEAITIAQSHDMESPSN